MTPIVRCALLSSLSCLPLSAEAQSDVALYGQIDLALRYADNDDAQRHGSVRVGPGGLFANYLGLKGQERLNATDAITFQLESGFRPDTGAAAAQRPGAATLFGRQSWLGLRSDWGELRVGRQYNALIALYRFLPIGDQLFIGGDHFFGGARLSNALTYQKNDRHWRLQADLGLGEETGSHARKASWGGNLGYQDGAFSSAVAYLQNRSVDGSTLGQYGNLGAAWQLTPQWRLAGGVARSQESGNTRRHRDIGFLSLGYRVDSRWHLLGNYFFYRQSACNGRCQKRPGDPDNVTGGIDNAFAGFATSTQHGHAKVLALIAAYDLSRYTTLYAETDWLMATGGAAQDHLYSQNRQGDGRSKLRQGHVMLGLRQAF